VFADENGIDGLLFSAIKHTTLETQRSYKIAGRCFELSAHEEAPDTKIIYRSDDAQPHTGRSGKDE